MSAALHRAGTCSRWSKTTTSRCRRSSPGSRCGRSPRAEILEHLDDFGLGSDLAHGKIKQLSGGQRQRLVICAAFWSKPHLIALDEPTNYLDNDTLAALTQALKGFKGAVVTVSHNEDFVKEISNERWVVAGGSVTVEQLRDAKAR